MRHVSTDPNSPYAPGGPGQPFKPEAEPLPGETVLAKSAHSPFVGTSLAEDLQGRRDLVICGVITNNSVEATARHAADLGFRVMLAEDACFTFAKRDHAGVLRSAEDVHAMSLANLQGEYSAVWTTEQVLARI